MKPLRIIAIILSLVIVILFVSGCQESDKSKYEKAQLLMAKGEYTEAAEKFDELGTYEEASTMSTYCKAVIAGESGDYDTAISTLKMLGEFMDSQSKIDDYAAKAMKINYEKAQSLMAQNQFAEAGILFDELGDYEESSKLSMYCKAIVASENGNYDEAISIFKTLGDLKDSQSRITDLTPKALKANYEKAQALMAQNQFAEAGILFDELGAYEESTKLSMYCKAAAAGESGDYETAFSTFETLGDYKESSFMLTYYKARQLESTIVDGDTIWWGNLIDAAELYNSNALFRDSKERAETCKKTAYDYAVEWAGEKRYSTAIKVLNALGNYSDSAKLSKYYDAYMTEQKNDYIGASEKFAALGDYKDAKEQVSLVMRRGYDAASELEAKGDQLGAYEAFMKLGDYNDSFERACKPYYLQGKAFRDERKWEEAVEAFAQAGEYSDAAIQIKATRYQQGEVLRSEKKWEEAVEAFAQANDYSDAVTQIEATRYLQGETLRSEEKWDEAVEVFKKAEDYSDAAIQIKATRYLQGKALVEEEKLDEAIKAFYSAGDYEDAKRQISMIYYTVGKARREEQNWDEAVSAFKNAGDYSDARVQVLATRYAEGEAKREAQDWEGAITAFITAGSYSDAKEQVLATKYAAGEAKRASQAWDGAIAMFKEAGDYKDAATQVTETIYQQAKYLYDKGEYKTAYEKYQTITGYKDVDDLLTNNEVLRNIPRMPYMTINEVVTFGLYEQDNNVDNGREPIEWIVLDVQDGKSLLLSKYGLDVKPYNTDDIDVTWEKCTLREWLNNDFLKNAFSDVEKTAILETVLDNSSSTGGKQRKKGTDTKDQIFLLNDVEVEQYLGRFESRRARVAPTVYADTHGARTNSYHHTTLDGSLAGSWWLRSCNNGYPENVVPIGNINVDRASLGGVMVRPAFWLDLESDVFKARQ